MAKVKKEANPEYVFRDDGFFHLKVVIVRGDVIRYYPSLNGCEFNKTHEHAWRLYPFYRPLEISNWGYGIKEWMETKAHCRDGGIFVDVFKEYLSDMQRLGKLKLSNPYHSY